MRLIDENKKQIGIVSLEEALTLAEEKGLDLVEVAPNVNPPVCRIMDYGKYLYELQKKAQEAKKHQKQIQIKEMKFTPKISKHDYDFKLRHIREFLEDGNKVKITVILRGRERAKPQLAHDFIKRVVEDTKDLAVVEGQPKSQSFFVSTVLSPIKKGGKNAQVKNT
ncbi:translation initiation factor IF-3 [SCandidatus Aminicenantes bacterium Aminicenantia_JdfR_composite]|nr:translation initiation factor IF-3 [SCandidatus Aminicenantes bacterium Aminicenantia_JdfR_composite]MCP2597055.1 translation initiation factor IF-3 [Candidatus Aminicenantes bacterium AC-335-G13]MCP2598587.1 translation initiation factor IF-3 [Candidatus Aminicenantes bacterium AC-335-L06]MCP2605462.1 translation initiation factor IF-3 [Candidatus Aminicenantes bacterium AC-335-O07]